MRIDGANKPRRAFTFAESSNGAMFGDLIYSKDRKNNTNQNSRSNNSNKNARTIDRRSKMSRPQKIPGFYMFSFLCFFYVLCLSNDFVYGDDVEGFYTSGLSPGLEMTTPEFDYASRGRKKIGDKCDSTLECGFPGSVCDAKKKFCHCTDDLPATNHIDKCGKEATINETCFFNEQCEAFYFQTECRDGRCVCRFEMSPIWNKDGSFECKGIKDQSREVSPYIDPAMIGVLVGMALMFIIICVVLRLFSKARWRENRTIFNTPNPRLMNVSLLRDSKLLHGQERRGSRMSVRAPSRQPSMASLRPHSPNPSLGSKHGSRGSSSLSLRSNKSGTGNGSNSQEKHNMNHPQNPAQQPLITNITANPRAESITVEIIDSEKT